MSKEERKKEIRLRKAKITRAAGEESRTIEGYAILFDVKSDGIEGFSEIISPTAVSPEVLKKSNIFCLLNHDQRRGILARSKYGEGTLELAIDEKGLKFKFDAPHTVLGDEVLEYLTRGEIDSCSFAFTVKEDEYFHDIHNDEYVRTVLEIDELYDVSLVYDAAYSKTEVDRRGLDDFIKSKEETEKRTKDNELAAYYATLNNEYNF